MKSHPRKVLIVDDDQSDVFLLNKMLRKCGVLEVESVGTTYEASKYMVGLCPFGRRQLPNLIFVGLRMAGMSGFHFISAIKKNPLYSAIPLVALSGSTDPSDKDNALKSGADAYYEKVLGADKLQSTVEKALRLDDLSEDLVLQH
ncbi:MAG: response regulator [Verrucomicrobiota bacterium]